MPAEPVPSTRGCTVAAIHWVGFLLLFPATTCAVGAVAGVAMLVALGSGDAATTLDPASLFGAGFLGFTAILQIALMTAGAMLMAVFLPPGEEPEPDVTWGLRHQIASFALGRPPVAWVLAGVFGALTIGMLPGWLASRLMEVESLQAFNEGMKLISVALADTSDPGWAVLAFAVVLTAPVCEELIFRGFLWRAAGWALPQAGVWLVTSALFAAYHMNPIHVVAVLPIGLFLGWLRWQSGSIWPCIAGHFANNALALLTTVWVGPEAEVPLLGSVLGFGFALACAAAPALIGRRPVETP